MQPLQKIVNHFISNSLDGAGYARPLSKKTRIETKRVLPGSERSLDGVLRSFAFR